jgi:tetratricopeptide (TPR) repeat protein
MMKGGMICFRVTLLAMAALSLGCQSLGKELLVSSPREQMEHDLAELEQAVVALDRNAPGPVRQAEISAARKMADDMEKKAAADNDYAGRLAAWSGRLAIHEGRYSEAQRLYRQSRSLSPGNLPLIILGIRLEGDPGKRLEVIDQELALAGHEGGAAGYGELLVERGRALAELRRFAEASGAFDTAFSAGLDTVYAETYRETRDRAWELRNIEERGGTLAILEQGGLTWKDCITLAKTETQLLRFLTAGREVSDGELFTRLLDRSFIPYTQDISLNEWPAVKPKNNDPVFRSGAAWFLWRLYAEARGDRGLLTRYSARFAAGSSPRSPIADLPPLSPFFDSVLGCVETEFLSLPDGRNFRPSEPVRGAEFLTVLKKIGN